MNTFLPPLRSRIFRGFVGVIGLYTVGGLVLLLWTLILATNLTPATIHRNYDSIDAAMRMRESWYGFRHLDLFSHKTEEELRSQFDSALQFALQNITEPGEKELVETIRKVWTSSEKAPWQSAADFSQVDRALDRLIEVNREGMFKAAGHAHDLKTTTIQITVVFLLVGILITFYKADGFAVALARPLKQIAEAMRSKPRPGEKLRLPTPDSLELRILIQEIRSLWERISETDKLNLEQIRRQSQKLQAVLSSVEDALIVIERGGNVTHCSDRMLELVGLEREHVVGHAWRDLPTSKSNYLKLRDTLNPKVDEEKSFDIETSSGSQTYRARCRSVTDPQGGEMAMVYLLQNVTERKKHDRLKAEFIGVLSHELKTPLQSLGTAVELLSSRDGDHFDADTRLLIETIAEDVARIRNVVNDFVQVSQLARHSLQLRLEQVELGQALDKWLRPFRLIAGEKHVGLLYARPEKEVSVRVDPVKFAWVVANLLSNAIRLTPESRAVTVSLVASAGEAQLTVSDEGPGVQGEIQDRIFEPYFKGTAPDTGGFLGIGLTIAKEMTEAHGGRIAYRPNAPQGAAFTVALPLEKGIEAS